MILRDLMRLPLALTALGTALALAPSAFAGNYACDCGPGSDPECVSGSDSNAGDDPSEPWQTYAAVRSAFGSLPAGGETRFCRGGSFSKAGAARWDNRNCLAGRCVIADYAPPWGSGDELRPIITATDGGDGFQLQNGGNSVHTGNVLVENLDLRGVGTGRGIFFWNDANDYELRNLSIDNFSIGIQAAGGNACSADSLECNGQNDRIRVYDSSITNNERFGWLGGTVDGGIHNSYFEGNGSASILDHNIYINLRADRMTVSGNRLYKSSAGSGTTCSGTSLTTHGVQDGIVIENNEIWEDVGEATQQCWGIAIGPGYSSAEAFTNLVIRGNIVRNVGNVAIGVGACSNCLIENNVVISEQEFTVRAIAAPNRTSGPGDIETTDITVRNNSIYIAAVSGGTGIDVGRTGSNNTITSNAIHYAGTSNGFGCMIVNTDTSVFSAVSNNVCYFPNAPGAEWANGIGDLTAWKSLGLGQNSMNADPEFRDPAAWDLSAASGSARMVDAGDPQLSSPLAIGGLVRSALPDSGAFEFEPILLAPPAAPVLLD